MKVRKPSGGTFNAESPPKRKKVKLAGQPHTGGTVPSWKGGPVKPGGIGVPPKKLT